MEHSETTIIGAGLAGLTAATYLPGDRVQIIEQDPDVGGRLATIQLGDATFDHGAQFFTVRSDEFRGDVDRWLELGLVEEWCQGFAEIDGYPRYRVAGGMNQLARHLASELSASGVEVVTDRQVKSVAPGETGWRVNTNKPGGGTPERVESAAVLLTPPVPHSMALLSAGGVDVDDEYRDLLADFGYHKVIALLAVLDRSPGLADPGALQQPDDPTFSFVADNQAKEISAAPAVTFHTAHQLSAELWSASDDEIAAALLGPAGALLGSARIVEHHIQRWDSSGPLAPYPERCLLAATSPGPLVLAGDGFGTSKVEGAYLSGRAAAETIRASLA